MYRLVIILFTVFILIPTWVCDRSVIFILVRETLNSVESTFQYLDVVSETSVPILQNSFTELCRAAIILEEHKKLHSKDTQKYTQQTTQL